MIALPVLLVLMLATAEFARGLVQYNILTKTARDGARHLAANALFGSTDRVVISNELRGETQNLVVYGQIAPASQALLPNLSTDHVAVAEAPGNMVSVSVDYPYQPMLGAELPMFGVGSDKSLDFNLRATVVMRAL